MLSSLPPELLRDIIEATVPHIFHSATYKNRQKTLSSLSLVSKLFRSIAQPLLLEIVYVKSLRQLEILPTSRDEGGVGANGNKGIKSAVIQLETGTDYLPGNVGAGFHTIKNVESLTLDGHYQRRVDLSLISSFQSMLTPTLAAASRTRAHKPLLQTDLSSLHLSGCKAAGTEPVVFPCLRSLTLTFVDAATVAGLLDPVSLPQLEEFAWYDGPEAINYVIEHSSLNRLLLQLEVLIFSFFAWRDLADGEVRSAASRTLVDCGSYQLSDLSESTFRPVHLRIYGLSDLDEHTQRTTFSKKTANLTKYIKANPSLPLRSVYLTCVDPSTVHLSSSSKGYVEDLYRVCEERKIDLIFEMGPKNRAVDPCFSPDFSSRRKRETRTENAE
jgi:hypothetical protein